MGGKRKGAKDGGPPMASVKTAGGERYYGGALPKGQQRLWRERRAGEDLRPLDVSRKHALQWRWLAEEIMTVDNLLTPQEARELVRPQLQQQSRSFVGGMILRRLLCTLGAGSLLCLQLVLRRVVLLSSILFISSWKAN
jgi:hypothetical protein